MTSQRTRTADSRDRALRASEHRFARAFYASPIAMAITTLAEGRYVDVNEAFERQIGYTREEVCGRTSLELKVWPTPGDRAAMVTSLQRQKTLRDQHAQFRTKSGRLITTLYSASLITFDGRPSVLAAIADITAQQLAEDALRESESRFRMLVAKSPFGIMVGGRDHRIQFSNPAFQRMFQYAEEEVVGKDPDELVGGPGNAEASEFSRRVLNGEVVHATTARRRKDGSTVNVELHAIPLVSGNEFVGCFGIYHDITQRVESEGKLRALRDRLGRVQDEERAHIARELHDDIGQRLALLAIQLAEIQKAARTVAPSLVEQLEASFELTGEISADAHRLSYRLHPSQLAYLGLTRALSSFCEEFARQNHLEIDFDYAELPPLSPDVMTCLYRVAQEAVRNAERHSGSRRVRIELAATPESIRLCVSDAGRGFDSAAAEGSRGVGLMSMAERVRNVGGELSIWSEPHRGTRIEVSIPAMSV